MSTQAIEKNPSIPTDVQKSENTGHLEGRKVVKWQKPLFTALIILGIISLGVVGGIGFASIGNHLGWWVAGGLNLSPFGASVMTVVGGLGGLGSIFCGAVGCDKTNQKSG